MKKNWIRILVIIAAGLVAAVCAFILAGDGLQGCRSDRVRDEAKALYTEPASAPATKPAPSAEPVEPETEGEGETTAAKPAQMLDPVPEIAPAFASLVDFNSDVVGWLKAGDNIDYPVVHKDNSFYLERNLKGEVDYCGTPFVNMGCQVFPRDDLLLIHGHAMRNGRIFGRLDQFRKKSFVAEHPLVSFRTIYDHEDVWYVPFAVFDASMMETDDNFFEVEQFSFPDEESTGPEAGETTARKSKAFDDFVADICRRSHWQSPVDVTPDDPLLMLITCSYDDPDGRLMVCCRRLRADETPEGMTELYREFFR